MRNRVAAAGVLRGPRQERRAPQRVAPRPPRQRPGARVRAQEQPGLRRLVAQVRSAPDRAARGGAPAVGGQRERAARPKLARLRQALLRVRHGGGVQPRAAVGGRGRPEAQDARVPPHHRRPGKPRHRPEGQELHRREGRRGGCRGAKVAARAAGHGPRARPDNRLRPHRLGARARRRPRDSRARRVPAQVPRRLLPGHGGEPPRGRRAGRHHARPGGRGDHPAPALRARPRRQVQVHRLDPQGRRGGAAVSGRVRSGRRAGQGAGRLRALRRRQDLPALANHARISQSARCRQRRRRPLPRHHAELVQCATAAHERVPAAAAGLRPGWC